MSASAVMNHQSPPLMGEVQPRALSRKEDLLALLDPALRQVSPRYVERNYVIPICVRDGVLLVATWDPLLDVPELADAVGAESIEYCLVTPTDFRRLLMSIRLGFGDEPHPEAEEPAPRNELLIPAEHEDARCVALLDSMLLEAVGNGASDLHLEHYGNHVRVRIRVDGDLMDLDQFRLTTEQLIGVINVVKIRARLDITERRIPMGGRFTLTAGGHAFDLRIQTQPTLHGEHIIFRLLSHDSRLRSIEELGFPPEMAKAYLRLLASPSGLLLVVGPTGSGKSTTLYGGLSVLAADTTRKVITIEDPIEYAIEGIQQTQIVPELDLNFANAVRVFVREDPDVIFVGEIRDGETALEAIRASQTGHIVLSTLHSIDSVDAVQRLIDLGMHPNSIANEMIGIFAQRLAKRICTHCRQRVEPSPEILREVFGDEIPKRFHCFRGKGCPQCRQRGTSGRIAVVEFLRPDARFRKAVVRQDPIDEMRAIALEIGLRPMRDHALSLVEQGIIALEELPQLFSPEQLRKTNTKAIAADRLRGYVRSVCDSEDNRRRDSLPAPAASLQLAGDGGVSRQTRADAVADSVTEIEDGRIGDGVVDVVAVLPAAGQPGFLKDAQVLGDIRLRGADSGDEGGDVALAALQSLKDADADRFAEGAEPGGHEVDHFN